MEKKTVNERYRKTACLRRAGIYNAMQIQSTCNEKRNSIDFYGIHAAPRAKVLGHVM